MDSIWQDLKFAVRLLLKNRAFSATALIALTLGIGANTAIFSVVNAVLLRPLPFPDPDRLVMVWEKSPRTRKTNVVNPQNFGNWEQRNRSFESMAAYIDTTTDVVGDGVPERVPCAYITRQFFPLLGVRPVLGRNFLADEDVRGRGYYALISSGLWKRRYGSDPGILGRKLRLSGDQVTVVGIMPGDFQFPDSKAQIWLLYVVQRDAQRKGRFLSAIARLKPGITPARAKADMETVAAQLARDQPVFNGQWGATVIPLRDEVAGSLKAPLLILLACVGLVLLIACANVANLMLVRASQRQREMALRASLGATRSRMLRQLMIESCLLGLCGGLLGLLFAVWVKDGLLVILPEAMSVAKVNQVLIDGNVLLFTVALSALTALLFGWVPALRASQADVMESLRDGGRGFAGGRWSNRLRSVLVAGEIATALVLLIGAGLTIKSLAKLQSTEPGFRAENLLTMRVELNTPRYAKPEQKVVGLEEIMSRLQRIPGVLGAGSIMFPPMTRMYAATGFRVDGRPVPRPGDQPVAAVSVITPDYPRTMGIPLLKGRTFSVQDRIGSPQVVLINQALASRFFAGTDPIGQRLEIEWGKDGSYQIVGVVGDVKQKGLDESASPTVYIADAQGPSGGGTLVIRTTNEPMQLVQMVRQVVSGFDSELVIADVQPMTDMVSKTMAQPRFQSILLGGFAGLAVLLASVGVFGVLAYTVAQRTSEIGVRLALGAQTGDILRMILRDGAAVSVIGIVAGLAGSLALTRFLRSQLFEVSPLDFSTFAGAAALLCVVALAASYVPAKRATRVDAMEALRYE